MIYPQNNKASDRENRVGCFAVAVTASHFVIRNIFDYIAYRTIQNFAQHIQRLCADGFAMLHSMERICRKPMLENQMVFRNALSKQRIVKWAIRNHLHHQ